MQDDMEFFMDSYLPEIPKDRSFHYLKLFYLLPKYKELCFQSGGKFCMEKSNRKIDLEDRIHLLLDFILEKGLFSSWRDREIDWAVKEINSLCMSDYSTTEMERFREKILEAKHLPKLHRVLDVLFSPEYPEESTGFYDRMRELLWGITEEEKSYKKWGLVEYTDVLKRLDELLLSPSFDQRVFLGKAYVKDLLFILLDYRYPDRGYDLGNGWGKIHEEKRKDYCSTLKWYHSVKDVCLGTNNPSEEAVKPSDIKWMVDRARDIDTAGHLYILPLHYVLDLLAAVDSFELRCKNSQVVIEKSQKEGLDVIKRLARLVWDIKTE